MHPPLVVDVQTCSLLRKILIRVIDFLFLFFLCRILKLFLIPFGLALKNFKPLAFPEDLLDRSHTLLHLFEAFRLGEDELSTARKLLLGEEHIAFLVKYIPKPMQILIVFATKLLGTP